MEPGGVDYKRNRSCSSGTLPLRGEGQGGGVNE